MEEMSKKKILTITIIGSFFLTIAFFSTLNYIYSNQDSIKNNAQKTSDFFEFNAETPKTSGAWILDAVISIDGDAEGVDAHNWTTWVIAQAWYGGGDGTEGDPYLLENITISGDSTSAGLTIQDSGVYFTLNNITITNINAEGNGIYLLNVENGTLTDCNTINNGLDGILMENTNFTSLVDVTSTGNGDDGIHMIDSVVNTILTSNFSENTDDGLYMGNATLNDVSSSYFLTNGDDGICIEDSDLNDFIVECSFNVIGDGLQLIDSDNCTIILSEFWNNTADGVLLSEDNGDTKDNFIYGNLFSGNGINAEDNSSVANNWDNGVLGNIWADYSGEDANDDYIGDTSYLVPGTAGAEDNHPYCWDGDEAVLSVSDDDDDDDDDEIILDLFKLITFIVIFFGVLFGFLILRKLITISPKK